MEENITLMEKILSGIATELEKGYFNTWLSESDQNRAYYEELKLLFENFDRTYSKVQFDKAAAKARIRLKVKERQIHTRKTKTLWWYTAVASVILLIGLSLFLNRGIGIQSESFVYSTNNDVKEFILSDGSHIWLNSNSTLQVPKVFSKKQRKITLRGEAYFEISRDESKPFKIMTGNTITEVLGTTFNINMDTLTGDVSVIVNSGKVAFYKSNQQSEKSILKPNDNGQYLNSTNQILLTSNTNKNFISWKTGVLTFSDTPLEQVCKELSKLYKKNVNVDSSISGISLTGSFRNEKLEDILKTIEITLDVQISTRGNEIMIHN
jgi:transmembrane sensor